MPLPDFTLPAVTAAGLLEDLPPVACTDRIAKAAARAYAVELQAANVAMAAMRNNMYPMSADAAGLSVWEAALGMPVAPAMSVAQRRDAVSAYLQRAMADGAGSAWADVVTALIGGAWTYKTHDQQDGASPAFDHIVIDIPFGPTSVRAAAVRRLLTAITPATVIIEVSYNGQFILDASQLDLGTL